MKASRPIVVGLAFAAALSCRSPRSPSEAKKMALTTTELGCVLGKEITDAEELARICEVAPHLIPFVVPFIVDLVSVRDGARRAGVNWPPKRNDVLDGGTEDASR